MDRSLAGRAAVGRFDRSFGLGASPRAGLARGKARAARARRRFWRPPPVRVPLAGAALRYVWCRRRLRLAVIVLALATGLLWGGWLWLRHSSLAAVRRVQISGVHGPEARAIDAALTTAARHMSTLDLHMGALRAAVAPFAVVRGVRATASFPHSLRIRVLEQPPVASLVAGGTRTAVAADGVVLGPALLSGSLPTVTASAAPPAGHRIGDRTLGEALAVLGAAPAPLARLVQRAYTGAQGLAVVMRGGLTAYFGDESRPHAKWLSLALVLASERSAGASYVDVRVPARPAAGFAPGTAPPGAQAASSGAASEGVGSPAAAAALEAGLASAVSREEGAGVPGQTSASGEEASAPAGGEGQAGASPSTGAGANSAPEAGAEGSERAGH
jgi:cell division protein FtsQ